jgi:hypothetical protein
VRSGIEEREDYRDMTERMKNMERESGRMK